MSLAVPVVSYCSGLRVLRAASASVLGAPRYVSFPVLVKVPVTVLPLLGAEPLSVGSYRTIQFMVHVAVARAVPGFAVDLQLTVALADVMLNIGQVLLPFLNC